MGFAERQVGHMTFRKWALLYRAYKNNFDLEQALKASGKKYADIEKEVTIDDVIPI